MHARPLSRMAATAALAAAFGAAACRDEALVVAPTYSPSAQVATNASGEPALTRFAADVAITLPTVSSNRAGQHSFHVEQARNTDGQWRTTYSAMRPPMTSTLASQAGQPTFARIEVDGAGGVRLFDAANVQVEQPRRQRIEGLPNPRTDDAVREHLRRAIAERRASLALSATAAGPLPEGVPPFRPAPLASLVVDPTRPPVLSALRARMQRTGGSGSLHRFSTTTEWGTLEVVVDSVLGQIVEITHRPATGPAIRTVYGYAPVSNGQLVRTSTRQERAAHGGRPASVFETRLTNVQLDEGRAP